MRTTDLVRAAFVAVLGTLLVGPASMLAQDGSPSSSPSAELTTLIPTPAQAEGPYYPTEIPADHDDDLTVVAGAPDVAVGTPLGLRGLLLDTAGRPVEGATVEIWQTDANGIYLHPRDPAVADRDPGFGGYGESVTDADGAWSFRTILPNIYGGRPRHIHAKVRMGDRELLTTQIYFSDAGEPLEGAVSSTGSALDALIVELVPTTTPDGIAAFEAVHRIVLP